MSVRRIVRLEPTEQRVHLRKLDVTVRVQEIGEGPPVVLIHGASVARTSWINLVQGLNGFRCIVRPLTAAGSRSPRHDDTQATCPRVTSGPLAEARMREWRSRERFFESIDVDVDESNIRPGSRYFGPPTR